MARIGTFLIATFSIITLWSIYAAAGPIGERPTTTIVDEATTTKALELTTEVSLLNETSSLTSVIDTLTTEIDVAEGNETHIRQKRSCGCCCCRPCCCCCRPCCCCCRCCCCRCCCCCCRCCCCRCCCCRPCCCCGGCGCCGCGGGRKRRAIQDLSHKLMNKQAELARQIAFNSNEEAHEIAITTTTTEAPLLETTTLEAEIRRVTNAKIDSYGRRQF